VYITDCLSNFSLFLTVIFTSMKHSLVFSGPQFCESGEVYVCHMNSKVSCLGLGCNSVVQCSPSMREALDLIPAPKKKRPKKTTTTKKNLS
jgi:hypothetical protein